MTEERHRELMQEALRLDAEAHRRLLTGDEQGARELLRQASERYRESWEAAPPGSYGRLVGMIKAAVLAGEGETAAAYVHAAIDDPPPSPAAAYALAIAALAVDDRELAARAAATMKEAPDDAFRRTADAIIALATRDDVAYRRTLEEIVRDFEGRDEHLTGVPIADTALLLERLAQTRGMAVHPQSALLPPAV
jgi:hypothetical protein